jgi:outer membrane protein TolC
VEVEKKNIRLKYDYNQLFPQLDVTGSYGYSGSGTEFSGTFGQIADIESPSWSVGAVLSIPLSNRQARYNYRTTKTERELAILQVKKKEQEVMVEVDNAIAQARSSLEQIEARRQATQFAQSAYEAEQKKMENGKSTSFQVLVLQRQLTDQRYMEIRALSTYNRSLADLALKEGTTLERRSIAVETKP